MGLLPGGPDWERTVSLPGFTTTTDMFPTQVVVSHKLALPSTAAGDGAQVRVLGGEQGWEM